MSAPDTIRLLLINDSRSEAERLTSMLRNSGKPNRAQLVESEEALNKLLEEQAWDLLIGHFEAEHLPPRTAIKLIQRLNKDIPTILLAEDENHSQAVVEGLKMGAADVVELDQDQHLLLVIQRELTNRSYRQKQRVAERRFKEAERRSQQLLDSSRDAIAYVQDGLFLYANESFAERFGYTDKDDIECMPVIDMVTDADQNSVKEFLKEYTLKGDQAENTQLNCKVTCADESEIDLSFQISNATYDEEPCLRFLIQTKVADQEVLTAELDKLKKQDQATGLPNRTSLLQQIDSTIDKASEKQLTCAYLHIDIDNFETSVHEALGITATDTVINQLAELINQHTSNEHFLARFSDSTLGMTVDHISATVIQEQAEALCSAIEQHIFDVAGRTTQLAVTIGISLINDTTSNTEMVIDNASKTVNKLRNLDQKQHAALYEPEFTEGSINQDNIEQLVKKALDQNLFHLQFQPIISLRGAEREHYEVLLRMKNAPNADMQANEFLKTAADMGATKKIDRWVILESIKMLSEHIKNGNNTRLILNVSRQSICDESILPWIKVAFKAAEVKPDSLIFQTSESDISQYLNDAKKFSEGLMELGSSLSIANFGCALNPFNTLNHIPCEYVKVDGSFTLDIQKNKESPETLTQLVNKLHELNKVSIVPFVENASVLSTLWQAGVHYIQGHYLQAPTDSMDYDFSTE